MISKTRRIERQKITIEKMRKELLAAKMIVRALSKLKFHKEQNPYNLGLVKRAQTIARNLALKKAA